MKPQVLAEKYIEQDRYRSGEIVVQVPDCDFDIICVMPNGQNLELQFRVEGCSLDVCLPSKAVVNCWKDDHLTPAKPHVKQPNCLHVKQTCFCLNPKMFEEKS